MTPGMTLWQTWCLACTMTTSQGGHWKDVKKAKQMFQIEIISSYSARILFAIIKTANKIFEEFVNLGGRGGWGGLLNPKTFHPRITLKFPENHPNLV